MEMDHLMGHHAVVEVVVGEVDVEEVAGAVEGIRWRKQMSKNDTTFINGYYK